MTNRLKMAKINAIRTLHEQGWSGRRISRELGVDRETVRRYVQAADSNPANAPTGSEAILPLHSPGNPGRRSDCELFRDVILSKLEQGLSAQRIYQDLTTEAGFEGSYWSVRRFVNRLGERTPLPFRRMECAPGEEAQVDFGSGAPLITADGKRKKTWVFRIVLSHSRKAYSEAVPRQTTEHFLRCLENAFRSFGGVPQTLVIDNLRAAVSKADWHDPGRFSTDMKHISSKKINGVERGTVWLLGRAGLIGNETRRWAEAMIAVRGIEGVRVLQGC